MDWPHKESTLWQWLPLSAPNGKQNWLPWCPLTSTQQKGVIFHWPIAKWFPVSLLEALDPQHCWRGCFCEISSSTSVRAILCCLSHLNEQLSSNSPSFDYSEFGSLLQQVHGQRQMGPFPFFSSIPLHSPAIQLFPIALFFCVLCHTFASSLNPHLNSTVTCPGFPCSSF